MAKTNQNPHPDNQQFFGTNIPFRKLIENSFSGISLLNKDLYIIYRTPSAERIGGWDAQSRLQTKMESLIHPSDQPMVKSLMDEVLQYPDMPKTCSFRSLHFKGHYIWLECTYTNMLYDDDVKAIVCNFRDISLQKQAEERLQQTVQELSAYKYALDEAAIVAITDQKGIIKHVNDNFCNISKYTRNELIGQDHRLINSSYHSQAFIRDLWVTIANGKIWKGELKNKANDGTYYWVDTTIVPFINEDGKPYEYIAIRSDITRRKQEEDHLRLLESVITNTTDAVIITEASPLDEPGPRIIYVNDAFTNMTGYTSEEVISKTPRILQGPKSDQNELKRLSVAMRNFQVCEITTINYKKNGEEFWINFSVSPVVDVNGSVTHFISIEKDITSLKQQELQKRLLSEAIAESLIERNTILESIGDAFFAVDKDWLVTYWNKTAEKVLFKTRLEMINHNLWDIFADAIGSKSYQKYHEAVTLNQAVHFEDYYPPLQKWYEVSAYPSKNGLSVYFKDVTERKKTALSLDNYIKAIEQQNNHLIEIAWMQSHVIRAPLCRIMGLIPLIQEMDATEDDKEVMMGFLAQSANELDTVIKNITDKSQTTDSGISY